MGTILFCFRTCQVVASRFILCSPALSRASTQPPYRELASSLRAAPKRYCELARSLKLVGPLQDREFASSLGLARPEDFCDIK